MHDLMSIGRFAQLTGLTVKALRLYDRRGILRPAVVDLTSGYRYYGEAQLDLARAIQRLRAAHMPLTDIQALVATGDRVQLGERLVRHQERLTQRIREFERALVLLPTVDEWCKCAGKEEPVEADMSHCQCSFCGKERAEVRRMIAGPNQVYICNECITLCNEIMDREESRQTPA